ncbi:MAG: hypothetical protein R3F24_07925 [Gammaproteobacteria bacterium]
MADDVRAVLPCGPAGLLLPKAESPADVGALDRLMTEIEAGGTGPSASIMALVTETAVAVANLPRYARGAEGRELPARLCALTWGGEDSGLRAGCSGQS